MDIQDALDYLLNKNISQGTVSFKPITVGASGAKLFLADSGDHKYVVKIAHESFQQDSGHIESYQKELQFYNLNQKLELPYIPNMIYSEIHNEYGIILVMEYYPPIAHNQWDIDLQKKAVEICAHFNSLNIDDLSSLGLKFQKAEIDRSFTEKSYNEWKTVLSEHKGRFDEKILDEIYQNIDIVCPIINHDPQYACYGDFHPDNILFDGSQLYICDWQNVHIGKCIGDISFFISRGIGFGINMNSDQLLDYYCEKLSENKGMKIDKSILLAERHASSVLNILSFWAYYLKNSSYERVAGQYNEMVNSYRYLTTYRR